MTSKNHQSLYQSKPPLIIDATTSQVFGISVALLKIVDCCSGKEFSHLDLLLQCAKRSELDEVYVCLAEDTKEGKKIEEYLTYLKEKKKRRLGRLRIEILTVPVSLTKADLIRQLDQKWGTLLSKGFYWIEANVNPPEDLHALYEAHKIASKKDSTTVATFYPTQVSPNSCMFIPSERSLIIADGKSNELLSCIQFDGYDQNHLDFKALIPLEGRWGIPPESLTVRSDLYLPPVLFGTSEMLRVFRENFDFKTFDDMIQNALRGEIKMEGVYIATKHLKTFSKSQSPSDTVSEGARISHGRQLYEYLRNDALKDSDKIADQGTRSSWKYDSKNKSLWFENAKIHQTSVLLETLVMENCEIEDNVKINNSIIGGDVKVGRESLISNSIIYQGVGNIPAASNLESVVVTPKGEGPSLDASFPFTRDSSSPASFDVWRPLNHELFKWNETPNTSWKAFSRTLDNDPSRDPDRMFDELYGDESSSSQDSSHEESDLVTDAEFGREVTQMLRSVVDRPKHVQNIILELRTYRLSTNKTDLLVVKAVTPVILEWISANMKLSKRDSEQFKQSCLGEVLESFSCADDAQAQTIVLDACWRFFGDDSVDNFVSCLYLLQPYMMQEESLKVWSESDPARRRKLASHPTFRCYLDWLLEEGSESE